MNQSILFNNDLAYQQDKQAWVVTGFYQSQSIYIYIPENKLGKNTVITDDIIFDIESDVEEWLEDNEPDNNIVWL